MAPSTTVPSASVSNRSIGDSSRRENKPKRLARSASQQQLPLARPTKPSERSFSAESYVKEYLSQEKEEIRLKRAARSTSDFYVPAQPKVYFVVRIRGINEIAPKPQKILQLLRLLQINNGVFVKILRLVEPYITCGEPNLKSGYGKVHKQRIPLSNNAVIKQALGQYNILSIEDLVHEIITVGPNFKQASNFLWPFNLSNPNGGSRTRKFKHYLQGGDFGDRETNINK
ncbi:putative 60s ribosomal protein L7 subunit [Lentinula edodes]|nr:putative 60s ribosomal protein L7 subunit [Lentinula edodes]